MDITWNMWWTIGVIVAVVVVLAIIAVAIMASRRERRTRHLKQDFGQEYTRTAQQQDGRSAAEAELDARKERVHSYELRGMSDEERARYTERWRMIQGEFIANPRDAVSRADELVVAVMMARGYPGSSDPDVRAADLSVTSAGAAESYRWAHRVLTLSQTSTVRDEDLRNAMMQYESVFNTLAPASGQAAPIQQPPRRGVAGNI